MEIGMSTACFYPQITETVPCRIQQVGIRKAEVFLNALSEYEEAYCKALRRILDVADIEVVSVHSFVAMHEHFLFSSYKRRAEDAYEIYKRVLNGASVLGAKYHTFHGARRELLDDNFNMKEFCDIMCRLSDTADAKGVRLAWENVSWCLSGNPQFLSACMPYLKNCNVGFTLDLKQAIRANFNYLEYIKIFSERLVNVHISDADEQRDCLLPGQGKTDFGAVLRSLDAVSYRGDLIIEVYNDALSDDVNLTKSVDYIRNIVKNRENISL